MFPRRSAPRQRRGAGRARSASATRRWRAPYRGRDERRFGAATDHQSRRQTRNPTASRSRERTPAACARRVCDGLHPRAPDRHLHGLERGRLRGVLQLRAARAQARPRACVTRARRPKLRDEIVTLAHGAGGKATSALVEGLFLEEFGGPLLEKVGDSAVIELNGSRFAFTTDSYVVTPIFFPGGSIGELAVNGTVNDLAVSGAQPRYLSAGFVIEEGFPVTDLRRVAAAMGQAAAAAGVTIAAGDTKVVERREGRRSVRDHRRCRRDPGRRRPRGRTRAPGRPRARFGHARRPRDGGHDRPRRPRARSRSRERHRARARARGLAPAPRSRCSLDARPDSGRPRHCPQRAHRARRRLPCG